MNIWITILLITAAIVYGLDFLFRRKKWKDNSKGEKISLIINMVSISPYIFLSFLGMMWGIASGGTETAFGEVLYDVTLIMASLFFIIAFVAVILSFIFRIIGKAKASIWINIIAFSYMIVVLAVNSLVGAIL